MKKIMKKIFLIITLSLFCFSYSFAEATHFIDFNKVLNSSKAGASAQKELQKRFEQQAKKYDGQQEDIRKEESNIIAQKKLITPEEYKKKVETLRNKVAKLQKNKNADLEKLTKSRANAKSTLLKALNPIVRKYMEENKIRLILDKKSVILGDKNLEITDKIITILNKELLSIKVN